MKWIKKIVVYLLILGVLGAVGASGYIYMKLRTLPEIDAQYLTTYEPSKILDKNGQIIWQSTEKRMSPIKYEEIPQLYKEGLIAVEDQDFWTNHGYSYKGIANMIIGTLRSKIQSSYVPRGGSTLEQQLIKNTYYNGGVGYETTTRKIQELFLAKQIDENFTKEAILTFYVNKLEFSEGATGIKTIMKTYFGKSPEDYREKTAENIAQLAYLIGLGQAPSAYNLYTAPEKAHQRTKIILDILKNKNIITSSDYEEALMIDLTKGLKPRHWESEAQYQTNLKYKVYTDAVLDNLVDLGYNINESTIEVKTFLDQDLFSKINDTVKNSAYYLDDEMQSGVTVIRHDGVVVGMVGARYEDDELNRATQRTRSSGSSTKPFTAYGPLFQYFGDQYHSGSLMDTSNYQYPGSDAVMYNYGQYQYGVRTLQDSLRLSLNTPVGRIDDEILGSTRMKTFLNNVGLDVNDTYSSVDGIGLNISSLDAAAAYNAINNAGIYIEPRFIDTITFIDKSVKKIEPKSRKAMNESTAFVLSQMLRGIFAQEFTAPAAAIPQYQGYAGKTGSVAFDESVGAPAPYGIGGSDVWYDSITNEGYSIAIWMGYDKPNVSPQIPDTFKGQQSLGKDLQLLLNGNRPVTNWEIPESVVNYGGSGVNTFYGVSDSQDIDTVIDNVPDLQPLPYFEGVKTETKPDKNWKEKLRGQWKQIYDYYQTHPEIIDNPNIIDSETYKQLGGR